jgi:hypothetical protein
LAINPPVANTDLATTLMATPVTLPTLSNDQAGNTDKSLVPSSVVVTKNPANGTVSVDTLTGNITYTPKAGFAGVDTLYYRVCDTNNPSKCDTAFQEITVLSPVTPNSTNATDDYISAVAGVPVTGNIMANDNDPQGQLTNVSPFTDTIPGKGILSVASDGSYTFTAFEGFAGPISYPYQICDNGTPVACDSATVYVTVKAVQTDPDVNVTYVNDPVTGDISTNDKTPGTYGTPVADANNPDTDVPVINSDGTYTFTSDVPGTYVFEVPMCEQNQTTGCKTETLTITVLDPTKPNDPVANIDIATTLMSKPVTLATLSNDKPGTIGRVLDSSSVTVINPPANGTFTIDPVTGNITYKPDTLFAGIDYLTYKVCDKGIPVLCDTAIQEITILSPSVLNATDATDDYITVSSGRSGTGSVLTNDTDPQRNTQTVNAQTVTVPGKGTLLLDQ